MVESIRVVVCVLLCGTVLSFATAGSAQEIPVPQQEAWFDARNWLDPDEWLAPEDWFPPARNSPVSQVPNMMGDTFVNLTDLRRTDDSREATGYLEMSGGADRLVLSQNSSPRPTDRVFFQHQHLEGIDLLVRKSFGTGRGQSTLLDRYLFGCEKTFFDGQASLELRFPFAAGHDYSRSGFPTTVTNSREGDISLIGKSVISETENAIVSGGIGVQIPTANGLFGRRFLIDHDATFVSPFLSFATTHEDWFCTGMLQADFTMAGDPVFSLEPASTFRFPSPFTRFGSPFTEEYSKQGIYTPQHLLRVNLGGGRWLIRNADRSWLRGLAGIVELHWTSTLNDSDRIFADTTSQDPANGAVSTTVTIQNQENRQDLLNLTAGLHVELTEHVNARIGASVPLRKENRQSDVAILVQMDVRLR
jgi:hypothetical protein